MKKKIVAILTGLALLAAVTGSGIVADQVGLNGTAPTHACNSGGTGGGGC